MTAAKSFDAPSPFAQKQEKDQCSNDEEDDEENDENIDDDANSISSLAHPSILDKDSYNLADPRDEFLRLTSMVRRVYFSYLHKSVISNYNICCQPKEKEVSKCELKKFAGQMELCAVKASLEASIYRQTMLKMISDIKSSTMRNKVHKKLTMFLETPSNRADAAVQTSEEYSHGPLFSDSSYLTNKDVHIQSANVTSNFDENLILNEPKASPRHKHQNERLNLIEPKEQHDRKLDEGSIPNQQKELQHKNLDDSKVSHQPKEEQPKNLDARISELLKNEEEKFSLKAESNIKPKRVHPRVETPKIKIKQEECSFPPEIAVDEKKLKCISIIPVLPVKKDEMVVHEMQSIDNQTCNDVKDIFGDDDTTIKVLQNDDEGSQDSLMQHLEDMFCESDDSSDLMTLIEKHSGVTKANIDSEIGKMCPEETSTSLPIQQTCGTSKILPSKQLENSVVEGVTTKRKLSFSNYKKMKKRAMGEVETPPTEETSEEKQNRKMRGIWFVERVHQVSKLKAKMMELSVTNYRKHGRLCTKFVELFGDPDEDEMMPDSPIHIEEHLVACKERIAPWVVKFLMPFYTKRVIRNRLLFKAVAKHIADMLIIENTFPEEDCVGAYVKGYFRNKTCIKAESDIYI